MPKKPLVIDDIPYLESLKKRKVAALHIHWDGSIPAEDLFALAQKKERTLLLPENDIEGRSIAYASQEERIIHSAEKLKAFQMNLRRYSIVDVFSVPVGFMQMKEDLIEMAKLHCRYLRSQNIPYAESRFAPQYHLFRGLSLEKVIGYSLEGFEQGKEETGVIVKPIICIGREASTDISERVVKAALQFQGKVVGIDLACEEKGNPPEKHYPAFALTFDTFLKRTVHAGEMCSEEENLKNVYTALTLLRADGLGHAIPLWKRMHEGVDLVDLVLKNNVRLESNPVSNYHFFIENIEDLHLDLLLKEGVLVTVNPDDSAMWSCGDLVHNLYFLGNLYDGNFVDIVVDNSFKAAWGLSDEEKSKIAFP